MTRTLRATIANCHIDVHSETTSKTTSSIIYTVAQNLWSLASHCVNSEWIMTSSLKIPPHFTRVATLTTLWNIWHLFHCRWAMSHRVTGWNSRSRLTLHSLLAYYSRRHGDWQLSYGHKSWTDVIRHIASVFPSLSFVLSLLLQQTVKGSSTLGEVGSAWMILSQATVDFVLRQHPKYSEESDRPRPQTRNPYFNVFKSFWNWFYTHITIYWLLCIYAKI